MQGSGCAWRRLAEAFEEFAVKPHQRGFDGGGADVEAHRDRPFGMSLRFFFTHNRLCIIRTLCNPNEPA